MPQKQGQITIIRSNNSVGILIHRLLNQITNILICKNNSSSILWCNHNAKRIQQMAHK